MTHWGRGQFSTGDRHENPHSASPADGSGSGEGIGWEPAGDLAHWRRPSLSPDGPEPNRFSPAEYAEFTADHVAVNLVNRGRMDTAQDQHRSDMRAAGTASVRRFTEADSHDKASDSLRRLARSEGMPSREAGTDRLHGLDYNRSESQHRDERR